MILGAEERTCFMLVAGILVVIPSIVMLGMSFHRLHTTEVGLDYNTFTEHVSETVYTKPGLHFLGLTHRFIRFPKTIQTMSYNEADDDILHTRTADGLPVTLGLSFQFRFETAHAYELYMTFGGQHLQVMDNEARSSLADVACNYSAYRFFADKQGIAFDMQHFLNSDFTRKLYASVDALQIETIELPALFQEAILESIKMKQSIHATVKYRENMDVTFQQQAMVAGQNKNQTITIAHGEASRIMEAALANARITNVTADAEMYSYGNVSASLGFSPEKDDLLTYIWCAPCSCARAPSRAAVAQLRAARPDCWRARRRWESVKQSGEQQGKSAFMVGVNQAVYVAGSGMPQRSGRPQRALSESSLDADADTGPVADAASATAQWDSAGRLAGLAGEAPSGDGAPPRAPLLDVKWGLGLDGRVPRTSASISES